MKIEDSTKDKDNAENKYNIKSKDDHENKNIVKNRGGNEDSSDSDITDEKVSINLNLSRCCNANVTEQKEKREQENKKKKLELNKEEKDLKSRVKEKKINTVRCIDSSNVSKESKVSLGKVSRSYEDLKDKGFKLIRELEEYEVNIKGLTLNWILERLSIHEEKYINMAINIAIQRNKYDINYITGILKNWLKEGYPKTYEEMEFESSKEKPKLRFNNFEARTYNYEDLEERLLGWRK
nr:DnaD domain protein [Clostridium beijerinckii]